MRKASTLLIVLTFAFGIISCSSNKIEKNKILKVSFSKSGGKSQMIKELEITEDSTFYTTGRIESKELYKEKTPIEVWKRISQVNLKEFNKIESGESKAKVDGRDEKVSITTKQKVYSFLNGKIVNSTEVKRLLGELHTIMNKLEPQPQL